MSAAPVVTDRSPPSRAKAAACAVLSALVPSQIALSLTAIPQPVTEDARIIASVHLVHAFAGFNIVLKPLTFCGSVRGGPSAQVGRAKREHKSPSGGQP